MSSVYWIHHKDHTDMFSQGYIGVSDNVESRWKEHKLRGHNTHLQNAINKYGWDNLVKEVIIVADRDYCLDLELKLRPKNQIGWNLMEGGGNPPSALGKKFGPRSEETKSKISAAKKGHRHTPEVEAIIIEQLIENGKETQFTKGLVPWNLGKPVEEHVKEAIRNAHLGKILTEEHKQKISKSCIGRKMSLENKEKLKLINTGRPAAMKGKHFPTIKCSHCNKIGGLIPMKRWHMDNCKFKEQV
jgi:group I intron endonuclease